MAERGSTERTRDASENPWLLASAREVREPCLEECSQAQRTGIDVGESPDRCLCRGRHRPRELLDGSRYGGGYDTRPSDLGRSSALQAHDRQTSRKRLRHHESPLVVDAREEENISLPEHQLTDAGRRDPSEETNATLDAQSLGEALEPSLVGPATTDDQMPIVQEHE